MDSEEFALNKQTHRMQLQKMIIIVRTQRSILKVEKKHRIEKKPRMKREHGIREKQKMKRKYRLKRKPKIKRKNQN